MNLKQHRALELVAQRARRIELLAALLRGGGLTPARAARILDAELTSVDRALDGAGLDPIAAMTCSLRAVIDHLGGVDPSRDTRVHDVLILDSDEVTADLVAIAVEAEGHHARVAGTIAECIQLFREREPDVVLTDGEIPGAPVDQFCAFLRDRMGTQVPIVLFATASGMELETIAHNAGADLFLSKDQGLDDLVARLNQLLGEILW